MNRVKAPGQPNPLKMRALEQGEVQEGSLQGPGREHDDDGVSGLSWCVWASFSSCAYALQGQVLELEPPL